MDFIVYILLLLLGGLLAGTMAGFLGVGGGTILTPVQYALLLSTGVEPQIAMPVAFATSLAVIFVTMIRGTWVHYQNNLVITEHLIPMLSLGFIGAIVGALVSVNLNFRLLEIFFGFLCLFAVVNMTLIKYPDNDDNISHSRTAHMLLGFCAGLLCGLLGVGGGIIMIPALTILLKYPTHNAIATSSATIIATSIGGLIAYILLGWNVSGLPPLSIGYVNLIQFVFLVATSFIMVGIAARLSKDVNVKYLRVAHIIIMLYIGLEMIGII